MRRLLQALLVEAGLRVADRIINGKTNRSVEERRQDIEHAVIRRLEELRAKDQEKSDERKR
jgi:hypothetical protein